MQKNWTQLIELWKRRIFERNNDELTQLIPKNRRANKSQLSFFNKRPKNTIDTIQHDSGVDLTLFVKQDYWLQDAKQEIKSILDYTWPLLITFVVGKGMGVMDVWFLGQLGAEGIYSQRFFPLNDKINISYFFFI